MTDRNASMIYVYVKFGSHRAREYGFRAIGRKPQGYWSLRRRTGPGGCYAITHDEVVQMRAYSKHARFTILRGPFQDLNKCWDFS